MERSLFDWVSWDIIDTFVFDFNDITLKVKIGDFEPGTHFDYASVDYDAGTIQIGNAESEEYYVFDIGIHIIGPHKEKPNG